MSDIRFVVAPLDVSFEEVSKDEELFIKEYNSMSKFEEDSVGQWLKIAKAKGETNESTSRGITALLQEKALSVKTAINERASNFENSINVINLPSSSIPESFKTGITATQITTRNQ